MPLIRLAAAIVALGVLPLALNAYFFVRGGPAFVIDFHHAYWPAGRDVLHGTTPYVAPTSPDVARYLAFIYPAVGALLLAPFALIGRGLADPLFAALNIAAAVLALRLLAVRDWRIYGLAFLSPSVMWAWHQGNVTLLMLLGIAAAWRWRDRPLVTGLLVALLVSLKLFVWPLGLWLLATRRYAAAAYMVGAGVVLNLAAWWTLGFDQIPRYRELLAAATRHEEGSSYSVVALAFHAGTSRPAAYVLALAVTALGVAACAALARAGRDHHALTVCVVLCLVASPIIWPAYFVFLLVPLAVARPRLSPAWLLLLPIWACPYSHPAVWQLVLALGCAGAIVVACMMRPVPHRAARLVPEATTA